MKGHAWRVCSKDKAEPRGLLTWPREALSGDTQLRALKGCGVYANYGWDFLAQKLQAYWERLIRTQKRDSIYISEVKFLLSHLFHQNYTQKWTLTNQDNKSVLLVHLSPIGGHFLVCGHIGCVILITLLALIHGFICFLIFSTKTETSSKASCKYKKNIFSNKN